MNNATPFFSGFPLLLFGKPPVSALNKALAQLRGHESISLLRKTFSPYIPQFLLKPRVKGDHSRRRAFSLCEVFWTFMDQIQTPDGSCRQAVLRLVALVSRKCPAAQGAAMSSNTSAYCKARAKIPLDTLDAINLHLINNMQQRIPSADLWHGRYVKLVDGTGISMPDTADNQARWPQSKNQKPGCGFPSMNLTAIFCLLTGALIKADYGDRHTHETKLFKNLWGSLNQGDLVIGDRGFFSFSTFAGLQARGVDSLMRLPEKKVRKAIGAKLPKGDNFDVIITWNRPSQCPPGVPPEEFAILPESISVRVVAYTVSRPGFRTEKVIIVTTLVDPSITADDLASIYWRRWEIELHLREIKISLHMDVLRCGSPDMIERELMMHFIAYNLARSIMQKATTTHGVPLGRLSFQGCLDTVRQFTNATCGVADRSKTLEALVRDMLLTISRDLLPIRPGRTEPRVKKRRPKNYRLMTKPRKEIPPLPHRKVGVEKPPKSPLS